MLCDECGGWASRDADGVYYTCEKCGAQFLYISEDEQASNGCGCGAVFFGLVALIYAVSWLWTWISNLFSKS